MTDQAVGSLRMRPLGGLWLLGLVGGSLDPPLNAEEWLGPWASDPSSLDRISAALLESKYVQIRGALRHSKAQALFSELVASPHWSMYHSAAPAVPSSAVWPNSSVTDDDVASGSPCERAQRRLASYGKGTDAVSEQDLFTRRGESGATKVYNKALYQFQNHAIHNRSLQPPLMRQLKGVFSSRPVVELFQSLVRAPLLQHNANPSW